MALENKLGLENSADLAREEERISKKRRWSFLKKVCLIRLNQADFLHSRLSTNISLRIFMILPEKYEK